MSFSAQDIVGRVLTTEKPSELFELFALDVVKVCISQSFANLSHEMRVLNVENHGLGIVLFLQEMATNIPTVSQSGKDEAVVQFASLAEQCLLQVHKDVVKKCPSQFLEVCRAYSMLCIHRNRTISSILPLRTACEKLQKTPQHVTGAHSLFLRACILSKCYKSGLAVTSKDLFEVDGTNQRLSVASLLTYFYYATIVCIAQRDLKRALHFCELAFAVPAEGPSAIVMACYKRYILISLLLHGKVDESPRHINSGVARLLRTLCTPYLDLANNATRRNVADMRACVNKHANVFIEDQLLGLVKQCVTNTVNLNIRRLTKSYETLSIAGVTSHLTPLFVPSPLPESKQGDMDLERDNPEAAAEEAKKQSAEKIIYGPASITEEEVTRSIVQMIRKGALQASIHQRQKMVSFNDDGGEAVTEELMVSLGKRLAILQQLGARLNEFHVGIQLDPHYVHSSSRGGLSLVAGEEGRDEVDTEMHEAMGDF